MAATRLHGRGIFSGTLPTISLLNVLVLALWSTVASATPAPAVSLVSLADMACGAPAHEQDHAKDDADEQQYRDR